jgi:periplasmic protein CpxP/Spy
MDYIKKNKFLVFVIVLLVVLNLVSISFNLFFKESRPWNIQNKERKDPLQGFIERELKFSDEQNKKYNDLRERHFKAGDSVNSLRTEAMKEFFELLKKDNLTENEIFKKASPIGEIEVKQSIETFKHFQSIRSICTPEQQIKFDAIVIEALEKSRPKPGNDPGPGGLPPGGESKRPPMPPPDGDFKRGPEPPR